jgi:PIN domain nuclease of toxin-antitoxin system
MAGVVLDASALLAFLFREPGMDRVRAALPDSVMSAVNLSEVVATALRLGGTLPETAAVLAQLPVETIPFTPDDAVLAGSLWPATRAVGLSLGDRCCLALGTRLQVPVLTADREWTSLQIDVQIEAIR